jgi:hypothetical protein
MQRLLQAARHSGAFAALQAAQALRQLSCGNSMQAWAQVLLSAAAVGVVKVALLQLLKQLLIWATLVRPESTWKSSLRNIVQRGIDNDQDFI